jgi:hypothetical protein
LINLSSLHDHNFPANAFPGTACLNASVRFDIVTTCCSIISERQIGARYGGRNSLLGRGTTIWMTGLSIIQKRRCRIFSIESRCSDFFCLKIFNAGNFFSLKIFSPGFYRFLRRAAAMIAAVCAEEFPAKVSYIGCRNCDYGDLCEAEEKEGINNIKNK